MAEGLILTAAHNGSSYPLLIAENLNQCAWTVDVLLRGGPHETWFYVSDRSIASDGPFPGRWMRTGCHNGFGAAFFHDDSTPPGADWAWIALNPEHLAEPPTIFYDAPTPVIFPPAAVMPLTNLREVILVWCATGQRPGGVKWLTVNEQQWDLDHDGNAIHSDPGQRQTIHRDTGRGQVVREYGWGTDRFAPSEHPEPRLESLEDHRTGRTAFGTVGPEH